MVDVEAPDLPRFPAMARARGLEATLTPGDTLWLPAYWYHHVRQLDEGAQNLSLNMWVGTAGHTVRSRELRERHTRRAQWASLPPRVVECLPRAAH